MFLTAWNERVVIWNANILYKSNLIKVCKHHFDKNYSYLTLMSIQILNLAQR